jgi:hypothetical protein
LTLSVKRLIQECIPSPRTTIRDMAPNARLRCTIKDVTLSIPSVGTLLACDFDILDTSSAAHNEAQPTQPVVRPVCDES